MGIILTFAATFFLMLTGWLGILYSIVRHLFGIRHLGRYVDKLFFKIAVSIDQLGNVIMADLFNDVLITKATACQFGCQDETISSVLGKNQLGGTLSKTGTLINNLLSKIQYNHSIQSIKYQSDCLKNSSFVQHAASDERAA